MAELGDSAIDVMQPAEHGRAVDLVCRLSLPLSWNGRVALERQMTSLLVVVRDVLAKVRL